MNRKSKLLTPDKVRFEQICNFCGISNVEAMKMKEQYTDIIKKYLSENEPIYESGIHSLMELLFWHYTEANPIVNTKIWKGYDHLEGYFQDLEPGLMDEILSEVGTLCFTHEQVAFCEGFRVGLRMMMELTETS